ncbi:MAG: hypothetical protein AMXMBFR47_17320 [Planctomycetota bacterium]
MDSHEAPRSHNADPAYRPRTTWRLRIGRLFLIFAGMWLAFWVVGCGVLIAASGERNADPMLGHWLSVPISSDIHVGILSSDYPKIANLPPLPPKLMVLFDLGGFRSFAFYAPFSAQRVRVIPAWAPLLTLFGLACLFLIRWSKPTPNTCRSCGYNLTGNVSGRCPECGSPLHVSDAARR